MKNAANMQCILVVMISLCWCEVDAIRCHRNNMFKNWVDKKQGPDILKKVGRNYLARLETLKEQPSDATPRMRQECRTLSDEKRNLLFSAFQWVYTTKPDVASNLTRYQSFMTQHRMEQAPGSHNGPCFPGWHREYLLRFELALKEFNSSVNLCYWDSSLDSLLPDATRSVLWTPEYFGNGNGNVVTGFAANLSAYPPDSAAKWPRLHRAVGGNTYLYTQTKINNIMASCHNFTVLMTPYTSNNFESSHSDVHDFVGGHMSIVNYAVTDPVFWFHHCFIDYLWEIWRRRQTTNRQQDYPRDPGVPADHRANDTMKPFLDKICIDGLSNSYIPGYYSYMPSPGACSTHADCGGQALWCNNGKCTASVRINGRMVATWPNEACCIPSCSTPRNVNKYCKCAP